MSQWTSESLRRAALAALGPVADALARDALGRGEIEIAAGVVQWEASSGRVEGHRVTLRLEGDRLERIRQRPAVYDALCAAFAAAVATRPGESLFELELRPAAGGLTETPYRGRRP
jgi:hypothetical protein